MTSSHYIRWFSQLSLEDIALVGGKNASLGELYRELNPLGVFVPNGFALTAEAYRDCLTEAGAWPRLHELLDCLDKNDVRALQSAGAEARDIVYAATQRDALQREVNVAWRQLREEYGADLSVAVRSSATAEDLPDASFAGQHETFLNIRGEAMLFDACRRCFASIFTDRAISYRIDKGFDHFKIGLSVGVMKMVRSRPGGERRDVLARHRSPASATSCSSPAPMVWVRTSCRVPSTRTNSMSTSRPSRPATGRAAPLCSAKSRSRWSMPPGARASRTATSRRRRMPGSASASTDADVLALADYAIKIEDHYPRRAGKPMPMDIEWAKDGLDGKLYIVQARPETVASQRATTLMRDYRLRGTSTVLGIGPRGGERDRDRGGARHRGRPPSRRVPARRGAGRRHDDAGLGAGDEDGRRRSSPTAAAAPATRRSWRASSAFPPWSARNGATRRL